MMKTPQQLLDVLNRFEDVKSAIAVYREANAIIKEYQQVKEIALDLARSDMEADGVLHHKDDFGSAGWTEPKRVKLDEHRWQSIIKTDPEMKILQREADAAAENLRRAQEDQGCFVLPESRFFIR
jgi:hypothetical protein